MKKSEFNDWLTLIANIAVLAGIIFLALEIQQSNRIATATAEIGIRNSFGEVNSGVYTDESLADILQRALHGSTDFTPIEEMRYAQWAIQVVNVWLSIETAYINGIAPEGTYGVIFDDMNRSLEVPIGRLHLRQIYDNYPSLHETQVFQYMNEQLSLRGS